MLAPYIGMKNFTLKVWLCQTAAALLCGAAVFAEEISAPETAEEIPAVENYSAEMSAAQTPEPEASEPLFNFNALWSGSWTGSESKTWNGSLHNRLDLNLEILPANLSLRGQILDRRPFNFDKDSMWGDPEKVITHFTGGLYHITTGSRLLYGVLDEWGLPARIRSPWVRSPPYVENHAEISANIKTAASGAKEDEAYLCLSTPNLEIFPGVKLRSFISGQSNTKIFAPALSGGINFTFGKNTRLLLEGFYAEQTLAPSKISTWFPNPPPLPQRDSYLYSAGLLLKNPNFSVSSDFALSETFAWGKDIYANLGVSLSPPLPFGTRARPLLISFAADGAGKRFIYRDGVNHGEGFRSAGRLDLRGRYNSLIRLSSVLRAPEYGEEFNRSSTNIYYRAPSSLAINRSKALWLSRISIYADRNAENPLKISDSYSGSIGIAVNLRYFGTTSPLNINISGSIKGITMSDSVPSPFPIPNEAWSWESASVGAEFIWSNKRYQLRSKIGYTNHVEKDEKWDFSISALMRFKHGRLSLKIGSTEFPEKWNWSVSWRKEIQLKQ